MIGLNVELLLQLGQSLFDTVPLPVEIADFEVHVGQIGFQPRGQPVLLDGLVVLAEFRVVLSLQLVRAVRFRLNLEYAQRGEIREYLVVFGQRINPIGGSTRVVLLHQALVSPEFVPHLDRIWRCVQELQRTVDRLLLRAQRFWRRIARAILAYPRESLFQTATLRLLTEDESVFRLGVFPLALSFIHVGSRKMRIE